MHLSGLRRASHYGDFIGRKTRNRYHLEHFADRLAASHPRTVFERCCLNVAQRALGIWNEFPDYNIFTHVGEVCPGDDEDEDEDYDDYRNIVQVEEYIQFITEGEGCLFDSIQPNIDAELNEKPY